MQIQDIFHRYEKDLDMVEKFIEEQHRSYVDLIPEITGYIINSGGKRLRPLLLMISSDLCGYKGDRRYAMAAILEFIHTASLLHDDVVDRATIRRGRLSANSVWGNSAAVLVGDYLYSKAFKVLAEDEDPAIQKLLAITTTTMSEGEIIQLVKMGQINTSEKEYLSVIEKKTAILISAACAVGALLAKKSETEVEALTRFGMRLGMAYQLTDDSLDYVAEEEFGKTIGMDIREGKTTLPLIRTLKKCSTAEKELIRRAMVNKDIKENEITEIVSLIDRYRGIEYAMDKAKEYIGEAKKFIDSFEDTMPKKVLLAISEYIIERKL
ncbi:MAG: polyprenyl synthetase family protein [Deltaproteobacteria bacterium]|nr:polyprenyl synthetase family protein [Deltaproteobacteria bacterium]